MPNKTQIGSVTILKDRKYGDGIMVPTGAYPVYFEDGNVFWEMEGYQSVWEGEARMEKIEPGLFIVHPARGDVITGIQPQTVRSREYSVTEFTEFLKTDISCRRGPERRLVFDFLVYPGVDDLALPTLARRFAEAVSVGDRSAD